MGKWLVYLSKPYNRLISRRMVQEVRFHRKWYEMDIAYIPPTMLIQGIVRQDKAK